MNNITNKDIMTLRLITEIRATAEQLRSLSIDYGDIAGWDKVEI